MSASDRETNERFDAWRKAPIHAGRRAFLETHLGAGRTLDVGCIDERKPEAIATSLHAWLRARSEFVVGVDSDPRAVEVARARGFEILLRDAVRDDLGGPYDFVVAGEVIEHVEDVGLFLANLTRHLAPRGRLLLTTPNAWSLRQQLKILRKGRPQVHARHTLWFDPSTLEESLTRAGLTITTRAWLAPPRGPLVRFLARWRKPWNEGLAVVAEVGRGTIEEEPATERHRPR